MVSTEALDSRLTAVENELAELKQRLKTARSTNPSAWWEDMFASFAESDGFEEATRLGREYRESLRPKKDGQTS
jgi:hypothetical protein